jgi:HAD superfamily hydrolase (TIGR01509 family)
MTEWFTTLDVTTATTLLVDADGTLFPSEEPAYEASSEVTNKLLAQLGAERSYEPWELQKMTNGKNFRASAAELAKTYGQQLAGAELDRWVEQEKVVVTEHLQKVLRPDPRVLEPVRELAGRYVLAAVTSSAATRLDACLQVTDLAPLFPPDRRFSAEDSLPRPTSKPDPAVYAFAGQTLEVTGRDAVAVEDSVNGALSAVAAGYPTIGTVQFVPVDERPARTEALRAAGVAAVVRDWDELAAIMSRASSAG